MAVHGNQLLVFGGFHDNGRQFRYHNDVYSFSLNDRKWTKLAVIGKVTLPYFSYVMDLGMVTWWNIPLHTIVQHFLLLPEQPGFTSLFKN